MGSYTTICQCRASRVWSSLTERAGSGDEIFKLQGNFLYIPTEYFRKGSQVLLTVTKQAFYKYKLTAEFLKLTLGALALRQNKVALCALLN